MTGTVTRVRSVRGRSHIRPLALWGGLLGNQPGGHVALAFGV